ncbi:MAG: hypothetical protein LBP35_06910 [Candidatus Ancillula trichonymphae]|nr:hypothetical protein [Candidatus Ancillula trichonymphae]
MSCFGISYGALQQPRCTFREVAANLPRVDVNEKVQAYVAQLVERASTTFSVKKLHDGSDVLSGVTAANTAEINFHFGYVDNFTILALGNKEDCADDATTVQVQERILNQNAGILVDARLLKDAAKVGEKLTIGSADFVWIPVRRGAFNYNAKVHEYSLNPQAVDSRELLQNYQQLLDGFRFMHGFNGRSEDSFNARFSSFDVPDLVKMM